MTIKERAIRAIQELPEDADYQALAQTLDFMRAVDKGLEQLSSGQTLTEKEVRQRLARWLSE